MASTTSLSTLPPTDGSHPTESTSTKVDTHTPSSATPDPFEQEEKFTTALLKMMVWLDVVTIHATRACTRATSKWTRGLQPIDAMEAARSILSKIPQEELSDTQRRGFWKTHGKTHPASVLHIQVLMSSSVNLVATACYLARNFYWSREEAVITGRANPLSLTYHEAFGQFGHGDFVEEYATSSNGGGTWAERFLGDNTMPRGGPPRQHWNLTGNLTRAAKEARKAQNIATDKFIADSLDDCQAANEAAVDTVNRVLSDMSFITENGLTPSVPEFNMDYMIPEILRLVLSAADRMVQLMKVLDIIERDRQQQQVSRRKNVLHRLFCKHKAESDLNLRQNIIRCKDYCELAFAGVQTVLISLEDTIAPLEVVYTA